MGASCHTLISVLTRGGGDAPGVWRSRMGGGQGPTSRARERERLRRTRFDSCRPSHPLMVLGALGIVLLVKSLAALLIVAVLRGPARASVAPRLS